jgi:hypothetical protein
MPNAKRSPTETFVANCTKALDNGNGAVAATIAARFANQPGILSPIHSEAARGRFLYSDKSKRAAVVPDHAVVPLTAKADPTVTAEAIRSVAFKGFLFDPARLQHFLDAMPVDQKSVFETFRKKQTIETADDVYGTVAELVSVDYVKTTKDGEECDANRLAPRLTALEDQWTDAEVVARSLPIVASPSTVITYGSKGVPSFNIGNVDEPLLIAAESALCFHVGAGVDMHNLPTKGSVEAVALYNSSIAPLFVGISAGGVAIDPVVECDRFSKVVSRGNGHVTSLAPFTTFGFANVSPTDPAAEQLDSRLYTEPAQWLLRDVAVITQRLVGRQYLFGGFQAMLDTPPLERRRLVDVGAIIKSNVHLTTNRVHELLSIVKETGSDSVVEPLRELVSIVAGHGNWCVPSVRLSTLDEAIVAHVDGDAATAMAERRVPLLLAQKTESPLLSMFQTKIGYLECPVENFCSQTYTTKVKQLVSTFRAVSSLAIGKAPSYPIVVVATEPGETPVPTTRVAPAAKKARLNSGAAAPVLPENAIAFFDAMGSKDCYIRKCVRKELKAMHATEAGPSNGELEKTIAALTKENKKLKRSVLELEAQVHRAESEQEEDGEESD